MFFFPNPIEEDICEAFRVFDKDANIYLINFQGRQQDKAMAAGFSAEQKQRGRL